jgi:hypothetical protein
MKTQPIKTRRKGARSSLTFARMRRRTITVFLGEVRLRFRFG